MRLRFTAFSRCGFIVIIRVVLFVSIAFIAPSVISQNAIDLRPAHEFSPLLSLDSSCASSKRIRRLYSGLLGTESDRVYYLNAESRLYGLISDRYPEVQVLDVVVLVGQDNDVERVTFLKLDSRAGVSSISTFASDIEHVIQSVKRGAGCFSYELIFKYRKSPE